MSSGWFFFLNNGCFTCTLAICFAGDTTAYVTRSTSSSSAGFFCRYFFSLFKRNSQCFLPEFNTTADCVVFFFYCHVQCSRNSMCVPTPNCNLYTNLLTNSLANYSKSFAQGSAALWQRFSREALLKLREEAGVHAKKNDIEKIS